MTTSESEDTPSKARLNSPVFATTQWTILRLAADSRDPGQQRAIENLCRAYWPPVYAFIRCQGQGVAEAEDLTQEFFLQLLRKNTFAAADPERGRFRTFLIRSLRNFLINERQYEQREKRGGGVEMVPLELALLEESFQRDFARGATPEQLFDRKWARAVMTRVSCRLEEEFKEAGKERQFAVMKLTLADLKDQAYEQLAQQAGMTPGAFKVGVHRFRVRYRHLFREEIASLVDDPREVESEIAHVVRILREPG